MIKIRSANKPADFEMFGIVLQQFSKEHFVVDGPERRAILQTADACMNFFSLILSVQLFRKNGQALVNRNLPQQAEILHLIDMLTERAGATEDKDLARSYTEDAGILKLWTAYAPLFDALMKATEPYSLDAHYGVPSKEASR